MRKPWDQYFMEQAIHISDRGTCDRARVGCVLTIDNRVIAGGYNGSPSELPHCDDDGHLMKDNHCVRTVHAEENAILDCAKRGVATAGATAYVTHEPCMYCRRQLIQAGIVKVIYLKPYPNEFNQHFIGNIEWTLYDGDIEA